MAADGKAISLEEPGARCGSDIAVATVWGILYAFIVMAAVAGHSMSDTVILAAR